MNSLSDQTLVCSSVEEASDNCMGASRDPDRFPRQYPTMVSVVVPARNAADLLPTQLAALARQDYDLDWEVIVVDNGSSDGTSQVALAWEDRLPVRVVPAFGKAGVGYARNVGFRSARGELIAFCDADDEVSDSWLRLIVEASLDSDAVGGALESTSINDPVAISWRTTLLSTGPMLNAGFLPSVGTANLSVWVDILTALDGFNEEYVYGTADTEFCWRLQLAGYQLSFSRQALVHYRLRSDLGGLARQFYHYGRGGPRLYRDFRTAGMPRSSIRGAFKAWAWLVVHLPDLLRGRSLRGIWMKSAARRAGRVAGSLEYRIVYL